MPPTALCHASPRADFTYVQGVSEELLLDINREATRRMTALVAPQASEAHGPPMLRLSMGQLFEEVRRLTQETQTAGYRHFAQRDLRSRAGVTILK